MEKPTIEQVAWVFEKIIKNAKENGSFRYLIYDQMGFGFDAYVPLYTAGAMAVNNAMLEAFHPDIYPHSTNPEDSL